MDLKKTDKDGNELNLTPKANRSQSDYYSYWKENPESLEPTAEDIKCELQLQALGDFEALHMPFDTGLFLSQIKEQQFRLKTYKSQRTRFKLPSRGQRTHTNAKTSKKFY